MFLAESRCFLLFFILAIMGVPPAPPSGGKPWADSIMSVLRALAYGVVDVDFWRADLIHSAALTIPAKPVCSVSDDFLDFFRLCDLAFWVLSPVPTTSLGAFCFLVDT